MCDLIKKLDVDQVTGYKIAVKDGNKYYSSVTGIEYKEGEEVQPVTDIKLVNLKYTSKIWRLHNIFGCKFNPDFTGKTMIFKTNDRAISMLNSSGGNERDIIIKMTLSGEIWDSEFNGIDTYSGTKIEEIEEI